MLLLPLSLAGLLAALVFALAVGRGWRRQVGLALAGAAVFALATLISLLTDCPGCTPEIGPWLAAFALGGWLAGIGVGAVVRRVSVRRPGVRTLVPAGVVLLALAGVVGNGRSSLEIVRWGCPSQDELERVQSVDEVVDAFREADLPLERTPMPAAIPPTAPGPRGGTAFRHVTPGATLYVVVCPRRCTSNRFRHDREDTTGQRWRLGMNSGNNVPVWVTEEDRRAGTRLLEAARRPLREVHPYVEYGSRCYIG